MNCDIYTLNPKVGSVYCGTQGGTLVLERRMSQGSLISFMLYQGSLSSAFDSLGYCFTGMSAAVGAQPLSRSRARRHVNLTVHCLCWR